MPTYEIFIDDDRYKVPSLYLVSATDETEARVQADSLWRDSVHHHGVEVRLEGERLYAGGSMAAERNGCGEPV